MLMEIASSVLFMSFACLIMNDTRVNFAPAGGLWEVPLIDGCRDVLYWEASIHLEHS